MSLTFNMVSGNYGDIPTPTEKTVSGAVVHITDALRKPAIALSTAINPVQDLHGYASPWPAGGGKNIFIGKALTQTINTMTFELTTDDVLTVNGTNTASGTIYFNIYENSDGKRYPTLPAGNYAFSSKTAIPSGMQIVFGIRDTSGNPISGVTNAVLTSSLQYVVKTIGQEFTFFCNVNCTGGMTASYNGGIQVESGTVVTAWSPFSNICPISGFSAANIVVSPTQDAQDGTTYTVQFGAAGTVYGGTLDVTTGELTVTHRYMLADGVNVKTTGGYGANGPNWLPCIILSAADYAVWDTMKTSYLKTKPDASFNIQNDENTADFGNSAHVIVLHIGTMQGTDGTHGYNSANEVHAAVSAYLQQNPLQICYELVTPQTYTLTPTEVQMLLGTNNVWSDTNGDVTLTYLADGRVDSLTALNMLLGNMYTPSADVSDREALDIIMGESE